MDRDGGDYSTDKISAALISEDTKRPASSSPVALTLPEWELLAGVLIPCVVSPSFRRDKEKVTQCVMHKTSFQAIIPPNLCRECSSDGILELPQIFVAFCARWPRGLICCFSA